ncbi:MAG: phosphatidylserine/phosphatidylglycerophosphate/cardiolipin synthase family protein [Gemmatimonadales bacterium]|nr:phosphatidylserine/phosphatidylglycerophosphate/cardiolipin synthase family protein [Gemmatimonadales bacterium]
MSRIPFVATGAYPTREGNRVRPLIDGAPAFTRICEAIDEAQARVWVAVTFLWATFQMPGGRGSFLEVLARARQRGLDVRVLFWRPDDVTAHLRPNAFWGAPEQVAQLAREAPGLSIRWDRAHPGYCQHQKFWLMDAGLDTACAVVGSLNLNPHSVVAPGHGDAGQNHDVAVELAGPAVTDVHHNFVQRWNEASERGDPDGRWGPGGDQALAFPDRLAAPGGTTTVQVQRTIPPGRYADAHPAPGGMPFAIAGGERSNHDQYLAAIGAAREYVYLEHQAVSVPSMLDALLAAARRGVTVVLVAPTVASRVETPDGPLDAPRRALAATPQFTLAGLAGRAPDGARQPVHVHAKLMLVDDAWATVGSCNLHRYSLSGNSELNVAFADAATVRGLRRDLLAEHLGHDTSGLDGRAALSLFRAVAARNAARRAAGVSDWEGIACALDPLRWWPG